MHPGAGAFTAALALALLTAVACAALAQAAVPDIANSRDPYGVDRFPRSWIVAYTLESTVRPRDLVVSRVDRIRRELQVENLMQVDATLETVTYQVPDGTSVADVTAHYRDRLGGDLLFSCEGRGCGRSADWANQVFEESILYGPDQNQRYAALEWQDRFVSLYVIERGNKRVYAHLRFLDPPGDGGVEPNALLTRRLSERGWAVIEDVRPGADGSIDAAAGAALTEIGRRLTALTGERVYVVCHLYGASGTDDQLAASRRCAEEAVRFISRGTDGAEGGQGPQFEPYGAGPLLPRSDTSFARLELVLPAVRRNTR